MRPVMYVFGQNRMDFYTVSWGYNQSGLLPKATRNLLVIPVLKSWNH
ncbi:hypothetical protein SAMN05216167_106120 [Spirosoma endophyticum]|uniref:Uncharacterized protein n=1 Tax=Spirosoma endophyticum TaxID=662367 RepID=A0A1I1U4C5_9BACT|nr:hypothetical protein SAMN05216167_106120 [Spirosoma endophyticum]